MGPTGRVVLAKAGKAWRYGWNTGWSRVGPVREYVATRMPTLRPPVLVLSLPRSGSSWVGEILGDAPNALYLDEPLTQTLQAAGVDATLVEPDDPPVARVYGAATAAAFAGLPRFMPRVIRFPKQWALRRRRGRRVVIKEVNPLICGPVVRGYRPKVILLVRHPAAVCLSYRRLGWFDKDEFQMAALPGESPWQRHGRRQAHILHRALEALRDHPEHMIVRYEDLCRQPVELFRRLYDFALLDWTAEAERLIKAKTSGGDRRAAYSTDRDSRRMADSWRSEIADADFEALMVGYATCCLPWYQADITRRSVG